MDEEFEPKHNANMIISKAVGGDYIGDEDSSKLTFLLLLLYALSLNAKL